MMATMERQVVLPALVALFNVGSALAQDATTTNPLNAFIGAAQSGAGADKSATAQETSATSSTLASSTSASASASSTSAAPPPPMSSAAAAATSSGLSKAAEIGIIVGAIVAALLVLALLVCLCCCLIRRHRRSKRDRNAMTDEEAKRFHSKAANPGREYNNRQSMEQHPAMPLMAAAAVPHGGHGQAPSLSQHPALRDDHREHHYGRDAALVGAGGLAAHEVGKNHGHRHNESVNTTAGLPPSTPHSSYHLGRDTGLGGGAAAYEAEKHRHGHNQPSTMAGGIGNDSTRPNHHFGRDAGLAGAGGLAAYEAEKHHHGHHEPTGMSGGIGSNKAPHTGNHHLIRDTGLAGAGGLAAYEAGKHHQSHQDLGNAGVHDSAVSSGTGVGGISNGVNHHSQRHQRDAGFEPTTTTGGLNSTSATHSGGRPLGRDAGLAGIGGLAAHETEKLRHNRKSSSTAGTLGGSTDPYHGNRTTGDQSPPAYSGGLGSQPTEQSASTHHYARDTGLASAGGVAAYEAEKHHENKRHSKIENPFVPRPPSPRRSTPSSRAGPIEAMAADDIPETGPLRDHSDSRSQSRPRSGGLPTHNDRDRPPTPFGLSGIGKPYEDMHVHHLVTDPPSQDLQQSTGSHEAPLASGALGGVAGAASSDQTHHENRKSRGYSTPPEVPSRSPNRAGRHPAQIVTNSSFDSSLSSTTRDSSSGTEQYQRHPDPYAPAQQPQVAPWEPHHSRFSQSPPTSASMAPPPKPWSDPDYVHHQRRQSHSPRQSLQYDGRRTSRSPATSINGQPRRLRFEDLQAAGEVPPTPTTAQYMPGGYAPVGGHDSYDGYDQTRWSQGVGEAL